MKFEKLQPGMTVYDVGRHKMGNTTLTTVAVWTVRVLEVDAERRRVVASWNTNAPRTFYERDVAKWREKAPMLVGTVMGGKRLACGPERTRMKLEDLHIGVSPLTDTIYLGTMSKRDRGAWASKVDCTSKFIGALMDWTPHGTVRMVTDNHGNRYEIEVRKLPPERNES